MTAFKTTKMIRFEHCDPAGLIFYPRYFQLSHQVIEDWFYNGLEHSHGMMVTKEKVGIPTVHIEADFLAASYLEEVLDFSLVVTKMGKSSVHLEINGTYQDEHRCRIKQVIVFTHLAETAVKSTPIPDLLRRKIAQFTIGTTGTFGTRSHVN